ncbi:MAG: hypothetical protein LBC02_05695, partial [Planctomycetaceae bacterium]|nr:hypothetical protein [Planctomycetaceae bacterium]
NGEGIMYGDTKRADFRYIEGLEDHDIGTMFFWDENDRLIAMIINIACPSQEVEGLYEIHADFWHPVREQLRAKYGNHVTILSWVGAAGDFSPHTMYRKEAEERMRKLRKISRLDEIARRITNVVNDCYEIVQNDKQNDIVFRHEYELIPLPYHKVTQKEYNDIVNESKAIEVRLTKEPQLKTYYDWTRQMVGRFESQQKGEFTVFETPVHIIRIGNIAVMSNPFELFSAYGIQMKARCKAIQTFIVQLTDAPPPPQVSAGYLPTADAYQHGGYSAIVKSIHVGPEGGQKLVEESLKRANTLFE